MKILKTEDHNYKIIYINDNEVYDVYRRLSRTEWDKFSVRRKRWYRVEDNNDIHKLEKVYTDMLVSPN